MFAYWCDVCTTKYSLNQQLYLLVSDPLFILKKIFFLSMCVHTSASCEVGENIPCSGYMFPLSQQVGPTNCERGEAYTWYRVYLPVRWGLLGSIVMHAIIPCSFRLQPIHLFTLRPLSFSLNFFLKYIEISKQT